MAKAMTAKPIMIPAMPAEKTTVKRESRRGASGTLKTRRGLALAHVRVPGELSETAFMSARDWLRVCWGWLTNGVLVDLLSAGARENKGAE
jgi:hypothetical protein